MNWKGFGRKRPWRFIQIKGLGKTTKTLSQDSLFPGWDLNPGPPNYEARVLITRPRRLVITMWDKKFLDRFFLCKLLNKCSINSIIPLQSIFLATWFTEYSESVIAGSICLNSANVICRIRSTSSLYPYSRLYLLTWFRETEFARS
jgi:hypothetical protein